MRHPQLPKMPTLGNSRLSVTQSILLARADAYLALEGRSVGLNSFYPVAYASGARTTNQFTFGNLRRSTLADYANGHAGYFVLYPGTVLSAAQAAGLQAAWRREMGLA